VPRHRSLNTADHCRCWAVAGKKIKLQEEPITEILVADTDSESGLRLVMLKAVLRKKKKKRNNKTRSLSRSWTTGCNKWGIINLGTTSRKEYKCSSFQQEVWKKVRLYTSTKIACHCLCWCFSQKFFICWWNRPMHTTSKMWTDKPHLAADCLTLHCRTWWLHCLSSAKNTLHEYWLRLRHLHNPFYGETMTQDRFLHILCFLHFADNHSYLTKSKNMTD